MEVRFGPGCLTEQNGGATVSAQTLLESKVEYFDDNTPGHRMRQLNSPIVHVVVDGGGKFDVELADSFQARAAPSHAPPLSAARGAR